MSIEDLREQIDQIDDALIKLLGQRFQVTAQIGAIKAQTDVSAVASTREAAQFQRFTQLAAQHNVPAPLIRALFRAVINEVVRQHIEQQRASTPSASTAAAAQRHIVQLTDAPLETAPDGSRVSPLAATISASHCHCTLGAQQISTAVAHRTVDELWYCLEGSGEFYCDGMHNAQPFAVAPGDSWHLPSGQVFQFRNTGSAPLRFIITTIPAWPGDGEAEPRASGFW